MLGAAELLLKLMLLCFYIPQRRLAGVDFELTRVWGVRGITVGWGGLLSLSPSTLLRRDPPNPELHLLPFSLPARPLSKKIKDSNSFPCTAKEKYKSAFTTGIGSVGPAAFRMEEQGSGR